MAGKIVSPYKPGSNEGVDFGAPAGAPVKAEVQLDNAHRTVWAWSLRRVKDNGNQYVDDIKVRLTLQKADQSALLFINPVGYMTESVRGTCGAATEK